MCSIYNFLSKAETDHLNKCISCKQTFQIYVHIHAYLKQMPMSKVAIQWSSLTEVDRKNNLEHFSEERIKLLKSLRSRKVLSAYKLYLKEKRNPNLDSVCEHRMNFRSLAKRWSKLPSSEKQIYKQRALALKLEHKSLVQGFPKELKKIYKQLNRDSKRSHKNAFLRFLKIQKQKYQDLPHREFVSIASRTWNKLSKAEKNIY